VCSVNFTWFILFRILTGAVLMAAAGIVAIFFAVNAERQSLENVSRPLSYAGEETDEDILLSKRTA
jgi:hypothetical protein